MKLMLLPILSLIVSQAHAVTQIADTVPNQEYTLDFPIEFGIACENGKGGMRQTGSIEISAKSLNGRKITYLAQKSQMQVLTSAYRFVFEQKEITGPGCLLVLSTYIGWGVPDAERTLPITKAN